MIAKRKWLAGIVATAAVAAAHAQGDDARQCREIADDLDRKIEHCSRAIEATTLPAHDRAVSLNHRGLARLRKGDQDGATADFTAAIGLDPQSAWAYNNRGVARKEKGELEGAIADYAAALALRPSYGGALANRGDAWLAKGDADRAIADLDAAIGLNPPHVELALKNRGTARMAQGDFARAIADFDAALQANPDYASALASRGYAHFCLGAFADAARDAAEAERIRPDAYAAMERYLAGTRSGQQAATQFAEDAAAAKAQAWPAPLLALFKGDTSPEQALAQADDPNAKTRRDHRCLAHFYVGEWYALAQNADQARSHLRQAVAGCDRSFAEYAGAVAELTRLK